MQVGNLSLQQLTSHILILCKTILKTPNPNLVENCNLILADLEKLIEINAIYEHQSLNVSIQKDVIIVKFKDKEPLQLPHKLLEFWATKNSCVNACDAVIRQAEEG